MNHFPVRTRLVVLSFIAALALTACGPKGESPKTTAEPGTPPADTVVVVNGHAITHGDIDDLMKQRSMQRPGTGLDPEELVEELISVEILRQEAERQGFEKRADVQKQIRRAQGNLLVSALVEEKINQFTVSEEDLRKEYDAQLPGLIRTEFSARHILVATEDEAKAVLDRLAKGESFEVLAGELSKDPGSGSQGGDLGWFMAEMMVEPFADAVRSLEIGAMTETPVESPFGFHIILLEDRRQSEPTPFEAIRGQIEQYMKTRHIQEYVFSLREKASVNFLQAPTAGE